MTRKLPLGLIPGLIITLFLLLPIARVTQAQVIINEIGFDGVDFGGERTGARNAQGPGRTDHRAAEIPHQRVRPQQQRRPVAGRSSRPHAGMFAGSPGDALMVNRDAVPRQRSHSPAK